nr:zinc finger protein 222-like isoform X3 [Neodiprion pinetum]
MSAYTTTKMALEEEAQICRLCGQCESIYIDVFGEEGTKRYLGLKIHTKINILIDEMDPLPKAICVQCLGKLEFVCDFQEECLRTQQLLRDRFNWPSPTDVDEVKNDQTPSCPPMNNNNVDKNQNPPGEDAVSKDCNQSLPLDGQISPIVEGTGISIDPDSVETSVTNLPIKQPQVDILVDLTEKTAKTNTTQCDNLQNTQQPISKSNSSSSSRSSNSNNNSSSSSTNNDTPGFDINEVCQNAPIANRLRSHGNNTENIGSVACQNSEVSEPSQEHGDMIQIPTSALNKVLTTVANSENMQVTVKESTGMNGCNEDINFIIELRHKQKTDCVTVLAKVFPDQGSCMVDRGAIVKLLENQNGSEIRAIVDKVFNRTNSKEDEDGDVEARLLAGRNPEDLFRMDGEEISVDENIEQTIVDKRSRYICRLCRKKYSRKDKCIVHVKTHLGIKQYLCTLCPAKFVCKSDVLKHIRSTHTNPRPFQCPKCPRRLRSKFDLTEHENVHQGIKPYACDECGLRYHHKVSLQMHAKSHLPSQNLACEYCGNVFPFRTRLLSHIASVHMKNRRNFRCHFCYNLYSSLSVLNDHIKSSHAATHVCEVCGKEFKVKSKYKSHVLQHKNPRPFSCPICNNKYASRTFLSEHLSKHQGLRKHVCQKCGATFAQASHLAAHRHVHGEKKYPCPDCGRRFNRQDNMKVHRKRHFKSTSAKPKDKQKGTKAAAKDNVDPAIPIEK